MAFLFKDLILVFVVFFSISSAYAKDVLYLGDSQAVLWLGNVVEDVVSDWPQRCRDIGIPISTKSRWSFQGYATGSSSFHHWAATSGTNRQHICSSTKHSVVIANGKKKKGAFPSMVPKVCKKGQSPLENVLEVSPPKDLVIFQFMGNSAYRSIRVNGQRVISSSQWSYELPSKYAHTRFDLTKDIEKVLDQLPANTACLVITTTPNKLKSSVRKQRRHAQAVIKRDITESGRCGFVAGVTPSVVNVFNNNSHFHGDFFHVSEAGAEWFFDHHLENICLELKDQLN